jgi:hypothetical protein
MLPHADNQTSDADHNAALCTYSLFNRWHFLPIKQAKALEVQLACDQHQLNNYDPYLKQICLDTLFLPSNPLAPTIIDTYIRYCDINICNNVGMTILHCLIWAERPDLAEKIVTAKGFNGIAKQFNIPYGLFSHIHCSALELAIELWLNKDSTIDLKFLNLLLSKGAPVLNPARSFFNSSFADVFYPLIVLNDPSCRSQKEIASLLVLLNQYGLSIDETQHALIDHYYSLPNHYRTLAYRFALQHEITIDRQIHIFDDFFARLHAMTSTMAQAKLKPKGGHRLEPMTTEANHLSPTILT